MRGQVNSISALPGFPWTEAAETSNLAREWQGTSTRSCPRWAGRHGPKRSGPFARCWPRCSNTIRPSWSSRSLRWPTPFGTASPRRPRGQHPCLLLFFVVSCAVHVQLWRCPQCFCSAPRPFVVSQLVLPPWPGDSLWPTLSSTRHLMGQRIKASSSVFAPMIPRCRLLVPRSSDSAGWGATPSAPSWGSEGQWPKHNYFYVLTWRKHTSTPCQRAQARPQHLPRESPQILLLFVNKLSFEALRSASFQF